MNPKVLISPHDDDFALFAAFTCLREKPTVVIVLDSYLQPARGEHGCSAVDRANETARSCEVLGCEVIRLGLRDDNVNLKQITDALNQFDGCSTVYAPALQGGNIHHDMVAQAALSLFWKRLVRYSTYTKTALYTTGEVEVVPTGDELDAKRRALDCHSSQIRINTPHFLAVYGNPEWLTMAPQDKLHLGCGKKILPEWVNLDREPGPGVGVVADVLAGIPFPENSFDYVYSEDFLEHLPADKRVFIMNEIWRVLRNNGIMEHYVPNAGSCNAYGSPTHISFWNRQIFEHFDVKSYRYHKDREYEGVIGGFECLENIVLSPMIEEDGMTRYQSIHVRYAAVKS